MGLRYYHSKDHEQLHSCYDQAKAENCCFTPPTTAAMYPTKAKWCLYHVPLETPFTHELSPKWAEHEELVQDDVKPLNTLSPRNLLK